MPEETLQFQAETSRLLDIVVNALYSEKQIFLRELISNASDACDRLRYAALTAPELLTGDPELKIRIAVDKKARTITVADNGIGMGRDELVRDLGTIARSGTGAFLEKLSGDARKDLALIGQFGVGFYSAFMVAERIAVVSRKAGETQAWRWMSDGRSGFTIAEAERPERGTTITLHLKTGEDEFLESERLKRIVRTYSDHIGLPIVFASGGGEETVNRASAPWTRPKGEITEEQHKEFYHHVAHAFDDPWATVHFKAEGTLEYAALLYVPSSRPFDLFDPARRHRVRLYVRRVFITDHCEPLVPPYLRFLRGVVDSEDLPLNVSREMLQANPTIARIRAGLTGRVLGELARKAKDDPASYARFWDAFGAVLKEGLYEEREHRDELLALARFRSTAADQLVTLDDYVGRMVPGQKAIYTISGEEAATLRASPHLEGFRARGIEVLLLTDPVDEFWMPAVGAYKDHPFKSVTRGAADLESIPLKESAKDAAPPPTDENALDGLLKAMRGALKDQVKDVRLSKRLTDSAACLVADEGDVDINLERLLRRHGQLEAATKRILEINPSHALVRQLGALAAGNDDPATVADAAHLLLDQARLLDGETLADPPAFARRLSAFMGRALGA